MSTFNFAQSHNQPRALVRGDGFADYAPQRALEPVPSSPTNQLPQAHGRASASGDNDALKRLQLKNARRFAPGDTKPLPEQRQFPT